MSFLSRLFGPKAPPRTIEDPVFGVIHVSRPDGWLAEQSMCFGPRPIQLIIDAGQSGPTEVQREEFLALKDPSSGRLAELEKAVLARRRELGLPNTEVWVSGVTVPSLGPEPHGKLWTVWFDSAHDDVYMFGVQTEDWVKYQAFADD